MILKHKLTLSVLLVGLLVFLATIADLRVDDNLRVMGQSQVLPGKLSAAHAPFEAKCGTCHTAVQGADEAKCINCHTSEKALLERQPTAFHANIGNCTACHLEHQGQVANLRVMNHDALARIGKNLIAGGKNRSHQAATPLLPGEHPLVSPLVATLDCATCHSTKDRHAGLFGQNCASCHASTQWTIPAFQHPTMRSIDCAQCHQAPPSHFMEHFSMVSKKVARQEKTKVNQCYSCHQSTSWNDIKGIGFYDHH